MNVQLALKKVGKLMSDNSPHILTGVGVAGTITTALLTGKATLEADRVLKEASNAAWHEDTEFIDFTPQRKVELVWKCYIPPVVVGGLTITSIVCANRIATGRAAALATAYSLSERSFSEYRAKVVEKLGETKEGQVREEIAQDRLDRNPSNGEVVIFAGDQLFMESHTGRYFKSDMETIRRAMNDINQHMFHEMYASLGDFQDKIGLPKTAESDEIGWTIDFPLEIHFAGGIADDGRPCIVMEYRSTPIRGYHQL